MSHAGNFATPHDKAAQALCAALGLDIKARAITRIQIDITSDALVEVRVTELIREKALGEFAERVSEFRLVPKDAG